MPGSCRGRALVVSGIWRRTAYVRIFRNQEPPP